MSVRSPHPVGNERADLIRDAVEQVLAGRSVFLFGEAGVGKSHVGEAVLSQLAAAGVSAARLEVTEDTVTLSAGATVAVSADQPTEQPTVASFAHPEAELVRLGSSSVLLIDDADRLSPPQYSWVRSLIERNVVNVVATFAAGHALPSEAMVQFSKLWRDERAKRFDLPHLSRSQTDQMIDGLAGFELDSHARARIHRNSGGLPLFVRELVLDVVDSSRDIWVAGSALYPLAPVPSCETIAVVQRRVQSLTDEQRDTLMVLALLDGIPMERAMRYFGDNAVRRLLVLGHLRQIPESTSILVSHPIEAATIRASASDDHLAELAHSLAQQLRSDVPSRVQPAA